MENPLQDTIDRVNKNKLDIIKSAVAKTKGITGRKPHTNARENALRILRNNATDAARLLQSAMAGNKVTDIQLRAAIENLHHVVGKPKVQVDVTHEVIPYNVLMRRLVESGGLELDSEGNPIPDY